MITKDHLVGFLLGVAVVLSMWGVFTIVNRIADLDHEVVKIETFLYRAGQ